MEFDPNKVKVLKSVAGTKGSKWDALADLLTEPGAHYPFDPDEVSKASAAQAAARLRKITGKDYHSGYHAIEKYTYVRLRPDGELKGSDTDDEEEVIEAEAKVVEEEEEENLFGEDEGEDFDLD